MTENIKLLQLIQTDSKKSAKRRRWYNFITFGNRCNSYNLSIKDELVKRRIKFFSNIADNFYNYLYFIL